jgi:hypothetical protein
MTSFAISEVAFYFRILLADLPFRAALALAEDVEFLGLFLDNELVGHHILSTLCCSGTTIAFMPLSIQ